MFFRDKSFYISLACGAVAVVGLTGLCISINSSDEVEEPVAMESQTPLPTPVITPKVEEVSGNDVKSEVKEEKKEEKTKEVMEVKTEAPLKFDEKRGIAWPVKGEILMNYSPDKVIYHKTLASYRTNPAILIGAKPGKIVKAACDGKVKKIFTSEEIGRVIEVDMGSGYVIQYGQLKDVKVEKGQKVKEGDEIGKISEQSKYYALEGPHLYMKITQNNKPVNPHLILR